MIHRLSVIRSARKSKPRASGDDPHLWKFYTAPYM